jgi:hypothetical protein
MKASYVSEHSLEYIMIPKLQVILSRKYRNVVPIYFWSTREGSALSKDVNNFRNLKLLSAFPRRPKLGKNEPHIIYGKINEDVLEFAQSAKSIGIPTVYCFPVINSLSDMTSNCKCIWMSITNNKAIGDLHFAINREAEEIAVDIEQGNQINVLSDADILSIAEEAKVFEWRDAILHLKELRRANMRSVGYWMTQYKPVYVLLFE